MSDPAPTALDPTAPPDASAPSDDAAIAAFLAEIDRAAERLRQLPLIGLTPEIPYRPEWTEPAQ